MNQKAYGSIANLRRAFGTKFHVLVPPGRNRFKEVLDRFVGEGEIKRTKNGPPKSGARSGLGDPAVVQRVSQHFLANPKDSPRSAAPILNVCA